jgi:NAD(P)-dependent dehydrogenase (short-subunit alcohol dehydrogenase family)
LEKRGLLHLEGSGTAVVVISSIGALRPFKGRHAIDDASKGMLQEWAGEVAERKGIHIWTLCPGAGENILPAGAANSAPMQEFLAQMPKQSLVPLRSIGHVIRFFGDPVHASYLNGQTLAAANGMHMDFREYAHPPRPNLRNLFFKSSRKRR